MVAKKEYQCIPVCIPYTRHMNIVITLKQTYSDIEFRHIAYIRTCYLLAVVDDKIIHTCYLLVQTNKHIDREILSRTKKTSFTHLVQT